MEPYKFRESCRKVSVIQFAILSWSLLSLGFIAITTVILAVVAISGNLEPLGIVVQSGLTISGLQTATAVPEEVGEKFVSPVVQLATTVVPVPEVARGFFASVTQPVSESPEAVGKLAKHVVQKASSEISKVSGILGWPLFQTGTTIVVALLLIYCVIHGLIIFYHFVCNVKLFKASHPVVNPVEAIGQVRDWEAAALTFTVVSAIMSLLTWSLYQGVLVVCLNVLALHVVGKYRDELKVAVEEDTQKP